MKIQLLLLIFLVTFVRAQDEPITTPATTEAISPTATTSEGSKPQNLVYQ